MRATRLRLTLVFAAALAVVLLAVGTFVFLRVGWALDEQIEEAPSAEAYEERDETMAELLTQLLIGGPLALALATLVAYAAFGAALRPVERSLARERRFVADAGHELRTPLSLLGTELELALRRPRSEEELRAALRSASEETARLVRLAEDLLAIAASTEGGLAIRRESVDVAELAEAVAARFAGVETRIDADMSVLGDRTRLEQALGNLVDNARRHGTGPVTVVGEREGSTVVLAVRDAGAGFAAEFLPRAFERFSRADEARARGGAGLGLAIVDEIARAHGGTARARNLPGGGAEVALVLPQ